MMTNGTSKQVRTQAMRDYLRKQTKEAITGVPEILPPPVTLEEPSQYKGRFKLNSWTHKAKTKSLNTRKARPRDVEDGVVSQEIVVQRGNGGAEDRQAMNAGRLPNSVFSINGLLDPFETLAIQLGPYSENLLVHCQIPHASYSHIIFLVVYSRAIPFLFWLVNADILLPSRFDYIQHELGRNQPRRRFLLLRQNRPRLIPLHSLHCRTAL